MGWQKTTLGEVCDVRDGTHDSPKYQESGYPLVTSKNLKNGKINLDKIKYISESDFTKINERSAVHLGDVLFAMIGTIGNPVVIKYLPNFAIKNVALFKPKERCDSQFLKYYLESPYVIEKMGKEAKGTTQKFVGLGYLRNFPVYIPPFPEQKRIVAILDQAFADIEQARAKTEQNLKNARELFESYLQQVFSQRGEGWVERTLEEISKVGSSKRIYETDWTRSGVPFYGGKEIVKLAKHGSVISNAYISEKKYEEYSSKYDMPQKGDILMTARGTIGVSYIVKEGDKFYYKDGNIISLRPKLNINPQFILYAFKSKQILDQLKNLSGTTVNHLPLRKAKELALYIPDLNAQIDTVNKIKKIEANSHQLIDVYESKLVALDQLKKSILQKAFSGELTKTLEVDTNKGAVA
ncbi:restriction endonuclease subunit S [Pseudoalteromonas distincta]|uniref:restriction endonuclease subunit S n=1 Tax=Pseudoalteromonas distincta TaxID=77608 RepID=UPI0023400556|nr:restriction endonuclease subunit S [Pseudoalteromonas distincta]MDC3214407.1 restriction endonuclease subunit S [Pseudoalteromonas distincta]